MVSINCICVCVCVCVCVYVYVCSRVSIWVRYEDKHDLITKHQNILYIYIYIYIYIDEGPVLVSPICEYIYIYIYVCMLILKTPHEPSHPTQVALMNKI